MNYYELLCERTRQYGGKCFLQVDEQAWSYAEFQAEVEQTAQELPELDGSVLVEARGFFAQAVLFFALQKKDCLPVLLHHGLKDEAIAEIVRENRLQACIRPGSPVQVRRYTFPLCRHEEADCLGVLSSGSTGTPKVMYRTYESWAGYFPEQNRIFQVTAASRLFLQGNLSFTGNMNTFLSVLYAGGMVLTSDSLYARRWQRLLIQGCANVLYLVPAKLQLWLERVKEPLTAIKVVFTGSQLLSRTALEQLQAVVPQAQILLYYGASELNYITYAVCEDPARDPMNLGKPFPGVKLDIQGDTIYVTTKYHVSGTPMPFTIEDTGHLNEAGELIFTGRRQNWINKGGFKISCTKVELELKDITGIQDAVVLPYADSLRGHEIAAFLVAEEQDEALLRKKIRHELPAVDVPGRILFLKTIPLNDRGKVDRPVLENLLLRQQG